jgi:hypothetical protein
MVVTAMGLLGSTVGVWTSLNSTIVENRKDAEELRRKLDAFIQSEEVWKDREDRYDREVRDTMRSDQQNINDALRQMNNRINEVALAVRGGSNGPK